MEKGAISRDDILKTLAEYGDLGTEGFLDTYKYGKASTYLILHDGKEYDSKAIAGVAHKHQHGRHLTNGELSGGVGRGHAVEWLKREGFTIGVTRNPNWTRDEIIPACDVVARNGWRGLDAEDPRVAELSDYLQLLSAYGLRDAVAGLRCPADPVGEYGCRGGEGVDGVGLAVTLRARRSGHGSPTSIV
ncbi:hypothetical protein ABT010_15225 [Streptomyces sp. NPDC002668]|uniref:hypothetical protein n=1 Tax=Streptomyces sp. NPDC002668 TaxID=3154422 RepID=UPI00331A7DEB